ncbi:uncharacterized protein LOC144881300 [Branchiostoma floridae x Branchiostoma japonicum]
MACLLRRCWLLAVVLLLSPWLAQAEELSLAASLGLDPNTVILDPFNLEPEVRLPCSSPREAPITYSWRKDGQPLDLNSRQPPYQMDAGELIIRFPEKSKDEGFYECVASNAHGVVIARHANLTFAYSDPFDRAPRPSVSGSQGEGAVLQCQKPGSFPGLIFFWVESGSLAPAFASTDQRVYVSIRTGDLYFARAEPNDSEDYQCLVRLALGEKSPLQHLSPTVSFSVTAQTPPQSAPFLVLNKGNSISSMAHATVLMEGFAYGNPIPTLSWRRVDAQGNVVAMPPAARLTMENFNRALTITDIEEADAGFYEVTATNSLGTRSQRTQLIVNRRPVFSKGLSHNNYHLLLGETVTWEVAWESSGAVDVFWLHNTMILTEGGRYRMTETGNTATLQIRDVTHEDSGTYQCTITNMYGRKTSTSFAELRAGAPSYVRHIRLTESGSNYAVLGWVVPQGFDSDDIGGYQVQAIPKSGGDTRTIDVGSTETTARIDGLNGVSGGYTYQVRAKNDKGTWGPWTTFGAPSYVRNMRLTESGDGYAVLGWEVPQGFDSSTIGGYQAQATRKSGGDTKTIDVGPGETTARVDGLNGNSDGYTYRVRAKNDEGAWGPWTKFGEDRGGSGVRTTGSTNTLLAWLLPLLFVLLLLLILLCCCCCLWLGLCGKYCPCCTCWTRCFGGRGTGKSKPGPGYIGPADMDKHHREMLKLYRPDAVKHVKRPDRVAMHLSSTNALPDSVIKNITNQHTQDGYNRKIVDSLTMYGDNEAFNGYCTALRKDKLYWLADTLEGRGLSVYRREQLMQHQSILVERMDPDITLAHLSKRKVFTSAMTEYVASAHSREEQNRRIIHLLQSRNDDEFSVFLDALRQNQSQAHLVEPFILSGQKKQQSQVQWNGVGKKTISTVSTGEREAFISQQSKQTTVNGGLYFTDDTSGMVNGQVVRLSVYRREQLMQHQSILVERMDPDITLAHLSKRKVFTSAMTEYVASAHSREEKNRRIIQLLQSRNDDEFSVFLDALRQNQSQAHLVELFNERENFINQQSKQTTINKGLFFTDASIKSGASAMVQIGQPVILEVNGEVDDARWLLNDGPLPQNKGIHVRTSGRTQELKIDAMTPNLAGTYTCQGTTPEGAKLSCDINITSMESQMTL